ncbi:hypothetical protein [Methanobacterium ferruginis]|uniref:hypothetical protein n=1 Tax=Methanobacterium ferruginis TaxID=710191 RepID=UPI00257325F1|nr:hypothetical protein [Methanobacterium ferruginis]BDZ67387.1 hypothetical protein GCM10025860_08350 [Methanobacterium ferruginis]
MKMGKHRLIISGIIAILLVVVMVSGCTSTADTTNMELLAEYNLTKDNLTIEGGSALADIYVTLPDDVETVLIKYNNISPVQIGDFTDTGGYFEFVTYNTVTQNGKNANNYSDNIIEMKNVRMKLGDAPSSGNLTLNINGAKSVGIRCGAMQGNIQVYIVK